jgi:CheY-like chemotaxis protein
LCRKLRQLYTHKPIVLYSTVAIAISPEQRLNAGASAYLTQPVEMLHPGENLLQLIEEARTTLRYVESKVADERSTLTA